MDKLLVGLVLLGVVVVPIPITTIVFNWATRKKEQRRRRRTAAHTQAGNGTAAMDSRR